jgi:hypothetical protein
MANVSRHHKKTRVIAMAALSVGVVGLGVAFAALSTTLSISGSAKVAVSNWDIRWENLSCTPTGEASVGTTAPAISSDYHTITLSPTFTAPGDTVTCNFDAANKGSLAAKLTSSSFVAATSQLATVGADGGITYTFKYRTTSGGATVGAAVGAADLVLPVNTSHQMQLILTNANSKLQGTEATGTFSFSLPYDQKNI